MPSAIYPISGQVSVSLPLVQSIHSGPAEHYFGPVVRDGTEPCQAALGQDPEDVQEVATARSCVFPWANPALDKSPFLKIRE